MKNSGLEESCITVKVYAACIEKKEIPLKTLKKWPLKCVCCEYELGQHEACLGICLMNSTPAQ